MQYKLKIFSFLGFILVLITLTQCDSSVNKHTDESRNKVFPLTQSWEKVIPHQEIPEGLTSLSSKECGACHKNHYEEWKLSTHAHAWTDLQFQSELKKESSPFMCINCHIPLQNQQEFIIKGLVDGDIYQPVKEENPHFDKELQQEGINCASCHVRNGAIIGPTGTDKAPHKTVKDVIHLSEELCISCHNANAVVTPTLACTFETGDEWKAGPFYGEKNCISCHMEPTIREIVPGFGERKSHLHFFSGSGIPKFDTVETTMLNGYKFYPSELKPSYTLNDEIGFRFNVKNELAGHKVPTGDPERFFLITFELKDENGKVLETKIERIGEHWEWYPEAKKLSDNNLLPGEERRFSFTPKLQEKGLFTLSIKVTKHRMDEKTAAYNKLGDNYPLFVSVFEQNYPIEIK